MKKKTIISMVLGFILVFTTVSVNNSKAYIDPATYKGGNYAVSYRDEVVNDLRDVIEDNIYDEEVKLDFYGTINTLDELDEHDFWVTYNSLSRAVYIYIYEQNGCIDCLGERDMMVTNLLEIILYVQDIDLKYEMYEKVDVLQSLDDEEFYNAYNALLNELDEYFTYNQGEV